MQRQPKIIVAAAVLLALAGGLYAIYPKKEAASPNKPAIPVVAAVATVANVPLVANAIGTIEPYNSVIVRARVDGHIAKIVFREGQDVQKGDLLAQLDDRPLRALADNAAATLTKDEATLANARRDFERNSALLKNGYASKQQVDSQTALVDALAATVAADKAALESARLQVEYAQIKAPISGRTGARIVDEGNLIHANDATGLVVINQLHPISAVFTLSQDMLSPIRQAMAKHAVAVQVLSRDNTNGLGEGELEFIDNQIDKVTGTFRLKARFANDDQQLWPGQFANLRIKYDVVNDGIVVPATAVQQNDAGAYVYVVAADHSAEVRQVETGQADEKTILITRGLKGGEQIIVDGQSRLKPGVSVRIVKASVPDAAQ